MHAEIFTSMADMENMVLLEKKMIIELERYIEVEEKKLSKVKTFLSSINEVLKPMNSTDDIAKYLGNPVNSYLMLKRFNVNWKHLEKILEIDGAENLNNVFETLQPYLPTPEDHEGAMDALFRLQTTYLLQSKSLAEGHIPGLSNSNGQTLDIQDIFDLGSHAYKKEQWAHAIQWFSTALERLKENTVTATIDRSTILDHLAYALFQFGDTKLAYKLTAELATLRPNDERIKDNLAYFDGELSNQEFGQDDSLEEVDRSLKELNVPFHSLDFVPSTEREITMDNYEKLCRGESRSLSKREQSKLKCWFRKRHPLLRIKPQKVERLWVKPEILLFHDFVNKRQSKWIKDTAHPILKRATIQDPITGKLRYADYRVSKSAWLSSDAYQEVRNLRKHADAVTGLDMDFSEHLQIANYGIGGHYEPHFDHARDDEDAFTRLNMGNRIATLLIYISDVTAGGPTVFTNEHAVVYPVKNAAVFWYNLKRNGKGNIQTRHAACPVLVGQKWVSNWWIHEYGQEFRRPCSLNQDW